MIEAERVNDRKLEQYTYVEEEEHIWYDKAGKKTEQTVTTEFMFVEGLRYAKVVARNGKPLEPKAQAKEDKKLRETAAQRRQSRLSKVAHPTVSLGTHEELLTQFDNVLTGEETLGGRKVWVVSCTPKMTPPAVDSDEKEVRNQSKKLWVDQSEYLPVREEKTVAGAKAFLAPGSTFVNEMQKVGDDVWGPSTGSIHGRVQFVKVFGGPVITEYHYSGFRKFDVKSTITPE